MDFEQDIPFTTRLAMADGVLKKHPDKIPTIIYPISKNIPKLEKFKYLLPGDITISQVLVIIRKHTKIDPHKALFIFIKCNNGKFILFKNSDNLNEIYLTHRHDDNFLYITYTLENTFG